jgi:hypothetical protein
VTLSDNFANMGPFIYQLLQSFYAEFIRVGAVPIEILRKDAAYVFTNNIKANVFEDLKLRFLPSANQFFAFVVIAALCCPAEIAKQQGFLDMFKFVQSQATMITLFRSEVRSFEAFINGLRIRSL